MATEIYTPTKEEIDARVSRFSALQPMSTATDLAWVGQEAMDVFYARKLMPVILDDTKNPFGNQAPIIGAAGSTMFISVMPPGQGPCLHSHNGTFETFMVLDGTIKYEIGEPVAHSVTLEKWDVFSCPPNVYRGFHNVGDRDSVQLKVITGTGVGRDDVLFAVDNGSGRQVVDGERRQAPVQLEHPILLSASVLRGLGGV